MEYIESSLKNNRMRLLLIASIMVLTACQGTAQEEKSKESSAILTVEDFENQLKTQEDFYLIDVRSPREFQAGAIEGAINYNISDGTLQNKLVELDQSKAVFVYCAVGGRSARAAKLLSQKGFKTVYDLKGGYNAWSSSNK